MLRCLAVTKESLTVPSHVAFIFFLYCVPVHDHALRAHDHGHVQDNMLGSDEGFREYLFDPFDGMKYALGSMATGR